MEKLKSIEEYAKTAYSPDGNKRDGDDIAVLGSVRSLLECQTNKAGRMPV